MAYNDGKLQAVVLNPRGALDTSNPPTDREPGTLLDAEDLHHTYIGPREGCLSFARLANGSCLSTPLVYNGTDVYAWSGTLGERSMTDVPLDWTLDWWGKPDLSGTLPYTVFQMKGTRGSIELLIDADSEIAFNFIGTSTRGTAATSYALTNSGVALTTNAPVHIRVVKDGGSIQIFKNGISALSAAHADLNYPIQEAITASTKAYYLGVNSTKAANFYKGYIYGILLRNGAHASTPIDQTVPLVVPPGTHVFYDGSYLGSGYIRDYGPQTLDARPFGTVAAGTTPVNLPGLMPVQGMGSFTNRAGRICHVVVSGGLIFGKYDR